MENISLRRASEILGTDQVCAIGLTGHELTGYSLRTLEDTEMLNRVGGNDWRLVYVTGASLLAQYGALNGGGFSVSSEWSREWLNRKEDAWTGRSSPTRFALIDFNGRWKSTEYEEQEERIRKMGAEFSRTPESYIAEAVFGFWKKAGLSLMDGWTHWGPSVNAEGGHFCVWGGRGTIALERATTIRSGTRRRVCVMRNS